MSRIRTVVMFALLGGLFANAQEAPDSEVVHPSQRAIVADLPLITAKDSGVSARNKAVASIVLSVTGATCDPDSQVENVIESNADASLAAFVSKIDGTKCVSADGEVHKVNASFVPNGAIKANDVVASMLRGVPFIMRWKGTLYVLYGVVYDQHLYYSGRQDNVIREFLLIDALYRDSRRFVTYDRTANDFRDVEGIASVSVDKGAK